MAKRSKQDEAVMLALQGVNIKGKLQDLIPYLNILRKIEHAVGKDHAKIACFSRSEMKLLLANYNINLHIKTIERRLDALIRKGMVEKFFESEGRATLYRVTN